MNLYSINDLVPNILPYVRGCTNFTIRENILLTAIDFCQHTLVSQETICDIDVIAEDTAVHIPCPSRHLINHRIIWIEGTQGFLTEANRPALVERNIGWSNKQGRPATATHPRYWVRRNQDIIDVVPQVKDTLVGELTLRCVYLPRRDAEKIDTILIDTYKQAMIDGTLFRLRSMDGEDWADPRAAAKHDSEYQIAISRARVDVNRDYGTAEMFVKQNPFA